MAMIPMECPKCGRWGSVPSNRLYVKLNCKKCQAPFYMNSNGDAVLGEPPPDRGPQAKEAKKDRKEKKEKKEGQGIEFLEHLRELSPQERNKLILSGAGVMVIVLLLFSYLNMPKGDPVRERALYVASAIADGDRERVKAASMPHTVDDVDKLLDALIPKGSTRGRSSDYMISADYAGGTPTAGAVALMVTLMPRTPPGANIGSAPDPRASKPKTSSVPTGLQMVMVQMQFVRDPKKQWRLDATTTLGNAGAKGPQRVQR